MAKSDTESNDEKPNMIVEEHRFGHGVDLSMWRKSHENTIHSGQFMVSFVHDDDPDADFDDSPKAQQIRPYDFLGANKETSQTYKFGPRSTQTLAIDASLTKLFECMTLAYSGKLTSPKWKTFRGLKLTLKDTVRLNNIIWREWHMQYIQGHKPIVCQFAAPNISDETHSKPEAVVLEGKYWKRRLESVTAEYKRWRLFYREFCRGRSCDKEMEEVMAFADQELLEKVAQQEAIRWGPDPPSTWTQMMQDDDLGIMDFSDTLFTLNQPFMFPNPREMSQLGIADIIQPGLIQLQPNLDEFMDTESLQDFLSMNRSLGGSSNAPSFSGSSVAQEAAPPQPATPMQTDVLSSTGPTTTPQPETVSMDTLSVLLQQSTPQANIPTLQGLTSSGQCLGANTQVLGGNTQGVAVSVSDSLPQSDMVSGAKLQVTNNSPMLSSIVLGTQVPPQTTSTTVLRSPLLSEQLGVTATTNPTSVLGGHFNTVTTQPQMLTTALQSQVLARQLGQTVSPLGGTVTTSGLPQTVTILQNNTAIQGILATFNHNQNTSNLLQTVTTSAVKMPQTSANVVSSSNLQPNITTTQPKKMVATSTTPRRGSTGSLGAKKPAKKDGDFLVPEVKVMRNKPRVLAPALTTAQKTNAAQNTFLATLLTTGTYPGAVAATVKSESPPKACTASSLPLIRPAPASPQQNTALTNFTLTSTAPVSDFQKSMLIAAAKHALGTTTSKSTETTPTITTTATTTALPRMGSPGPSSPQFSTDVASPGSDGGLTVKQEGDSPGGTLGDESPAKAFRPKTDTERQQYKEHRRVSHISAEQKRRCNIKSGFDTLHQLVPALRHNPNAKISKAATLQKTAEFCKKLKVERTQMQEEAEILRREIETLNSSINECQSQLPATGVPVTRQRVDQMRDMFDEYVRNRTLQNWKFWIFSIIIRPLFDSFNNMVSTASEYELCRSMLAWLEQHCSLVVLRPTVLDSLRRLSTTTSILSDPSRVPEQAAQAVSRKPFSDSTSPDQS